MFFLRSDIVLHSIPHIIIAIRPIKEHSQLPQFPVTNIINKGENRNRVFGLVRERVRVIIHNDDPVQIPTHEGQVLDELSVNIAARVTVEPVRDEPVSVQPVNDKRRVLPQRRREHHHLELLGQRFQKLVDPGALQDVEVYCLAVDHRPDDEVEPFRWRRCFGMYEGFVEVEENGSLVGERGRKERWWVAVVVEEEGSANGVKRSFFMFEVEMGGCFLEDFVAVSFAGGGAEVWHAKFG